MIAARRVARAADGSPVLPRIVERAPAPGDIHPISKQLLKKLLSVVPVEFLYGLNRIELRARRADDTLMGYYGVLEREIILYSRPQEESCLCRISHFGGSMLRFGAILTPREDGRYAVSWPSERHRAHWFYSYVVAHELGHHFVEQYKTKNGRIRKRIHEEAVADLHADRISAHLLAYDQKEEAARAAAVGAASA